MKWTCFAVGLGLGLASLAQSSSALALNQPDGTVIPVGPGLQGMFSSRGEGINALSDAAIVPETFIPSCGLTFEVIQRNADNNNSFGWYNVVGGPPPLSDHHQFLACTDPVGTTRVLDIKNDPAYRGGEIGFYQAAGPCGTVANHTFLFYSQRQFNPDGSGAGAFTHLLIYNSTATPRAFYFAWEDLLSGGDNDFDDLTTFVTGITCSGGGGACMTGNLGICAEGTLQCQSGELTCVQTNAQASEVCDGLDNDCDGLVDDGDLCGATEICDKGNCVPKCNRGEFECPANKECDDNGLCVEPGCVDVTCPQGQRCIGGVCRGPCDGIVCPHGQVCRVGACVDPCSSIICDANQVCVEGGCIDKCQCAGCAAGESCQADGTCIPTPCLGFSCPGGQYCAPDGTCTDACAGAVCPSGQACVSGQCVDSPTGAGGGATSGSGMLAGAGGGNGSGGGSSANGGASAAGGSSGDGGEWIPETRSACGCRVAGGEAGGPLPLVGLLGAAACAVRLRGRQDRRRARRADGR